MPAEVVCCTDKRVVVRLEVELSDSMLESEERIQTALNEAGALASGEALKRFDTDGSPIQVGAVRWSSKGALPKSYQTPYGMVAVERHVYQTAQGGKTWCPLEQDARIIVTATPRFAKQIAHKYAGLGGRQVVEDWQENHGRAVTQAYVQKISEAVGSVVEAKEERWHYATPKLDEPIEVLSIGMDGTCMLTCTGGYREAMTGTLSLYDLFGDRQHTIYIAATPEYGKETFKARMEREIAHIKSLYPGIRTVGVADGAAENWTFLNRHTDEQVLDFFHAAEYVAQVAEAVFTEKTERVAWREQRYERLKTKQGAAGRLLKEMKAFRARSLSKANRSILEKAITYFENHKHQMNYAWARREGLPIGSGVTEAACKTLVKQRLCQAGMRWKERGARIVLSLRALVQSTGRWTQFWSKVNQYGFPVEI